jgi:hypothetical protein
MNILSFFTKSGIPATGLLTPTVKVIEVPSGSIAVNNQDMTELSNGFYFYDFTTYDFTKDYAILCDGTNELTGSERYVIAGNESYSIELIKSEITEIIKSDSSVELSAIPDVDAPLSEQIQFIYQYFRNKRTVTGTQEKMYKENDTLIGTSSLSDDGTTFTKGKII